MFKPAYNMVLIYQTFTTIHVFRRSSKEYIFRATILIDLLEYVLFREKASFMHAKRTRIVP